ncbi:MAG: OmpA family protein [Desulfamplus sp.]|nr:OmpA family protein [Desulfamplus sp.]
MNCISKSSQLATMILNLFSVLFICCIFINFVGAEEFPFPNSSEKELSKEMQQRGYITQMQDRIRANEEEIRFLINEKDLLQNRIYHLQDLDEPVPWDMHKSMSIKEKKIQAAFRENSRLNDLLSQDRYKRMEYGGITSHNLLPSNSRTSSLDPNALKQKLSQEIRDAGLDEWLKISSDGSGVQLENLLPILFASGSARLANEYKVFLKRLAQLIKDYDVRIRIDGFADTDRIHTKQYPSNLELGAVRAANIVHELVRNGVRPSIFQIATTGEYRLDGKVMSDKKILERRAEISIRFI